MSDKRVVWQDGGVRITTDGLMQVHCGKDDWRTIDGGMLIMGGTLESLARALAESEAKRKALEDFATRFAQDVEAAAVADPTHIAFVAVLIWGREARKALKANPATDSQPTIRR